jgi:hypothetical protein
MGDCVDALTNTSLAVHTGDKPKFWDDLLGATWTDHERSTNSSNLKCSSRPAVARGEFPGHKILSVLDDHIPIRNSYVLR